MINAQKLVFEQITPEEHASYKKNKCLYKTYLGIYQVRFQELPTISDSYISVSLPNVFNIRTGGWLYIGDPSIVTLEQADNFVTSYLSSFVNQSRQSELKQINLDAAVTKAVKEYLTEKFTFDFFERIFTKIVNSIVYFVPGSSVIHTTVVKAFKDGVKEATKESIEKLQKS